MGFNYNYKMAGNSVSAGPVTDPIKTSPRKAGSPVNIPGAKKTRKPLPDHTVSIALTLPRHVVDRIDTLLGGPARPTGFKSGRAHWVRKLIYKALSMEESPDSRDRVDVLHENYLKTADLSLLETFTPREHRILNRILELRALGLTYPEVAEALQEEGFSTVSGKPWLPGTIHYYLKKLVPPSRDS